MKASITSPFAGGERDRAALIYGGDNEYVYGELLRMSSSEIVELAEGVIQTCCNSAAGGRIPEGWNRE